MQLRFHCIKQCMNHITNIQQSVTTVGYDELWWTSVSNKLSPFQFFKSPTSLQKPSAVCLVWLIFVCIRLSVLKESEEKNNLICIDQGKVNFFILTERQKQSYQCLRWTDLSNAPLLELFLPYYLYAQLLTIMAVICNFKYQAIYRSRSLSRYCS